MLLIMEIERPRRGGSKPGKRPNIARDFAKAQHQIELDYFVPNPVYPALLFQKRFRLPLEVYRNLKAAILEWEKFNLAPEDRFFEQRSNCAGALGASPDQKLLSALNQLAYGTTPDESDHYFRISKTVARDSLLTFCRRVADILGDDYDRGPTPAEVQRNSDENAARGFPVIDLAQLICRACSVASIAITGPGTAARGLITAPTKTATRTAR